MHPDQQQPMLWKPLLRRQAPASAMAKDVRLLGQRHLKDSRVTAESDSFSSCQAVTNISWLKTRNEHCDGWKLCDTQKPRDLTSGKIH